MNNEWSSIDYIEERNSHGCSANNTFLSIYVREPDDMSPTLIDDLFEIRALLRNENADQASNKLRQVIVQAEGAFDGQRTASDPLAEQTSKWLQSFLDDEFAIILTRQDRSQIDIQEMGRHVEERKRLLNEGLLASPALSSIRSLCSLIGHTCKAKSLGKGMSELKRHLHHHLLMDEEIRQEVAKLGQSMVSSLKELEEFTGDAGDDASELNQARNILSEDLPKEPQAALAHLRRACEALTSAEGKLGSAVQSISEQMKTNIQEVSELRDHLEQAHKDARCDPLTGLANRRELREFFDTIGNQPASLLMLDMDFFKKINDNHGHDVGDEILEEVGKRLTNITGEHDIAARFGGEEFVTVLKDVGVRQVLNIAEQIRTAVTGNPISTTAGDIHITASVGAAARFAGESIADWNKRADVALYEAKHSGRNCTRVSGA